MKLAEDIRPVTYLKTRAADLLEQVNRTHRHVVITQNGNARAVLVDPESFQKMRDTIGLLRLLAQGEADVRAGRTVDSDELFEALRAGVEGGEPEE
jgi:prevent-host-death family protein